MFNSYPRLFWMGTYKKKSFRVDLKYHYSSFNQFSTFQFSRKWLKFLLFTIQFIHTYFDILTYCKVTKNRIRYQISNFFIVVVKSFIHDRISNESKHQFHFSICTRNSNSYITFFFCSIIIAFQYRAIAQSYAAMTPTHLNDQIIVQ